MLSVSALQAKQQEEGNEGMGRELHCTVLGFSAGVHVYIASQSSGLAWCPVLVLMYNQVSILK